MYEIDIECDGCHAATGLEWAADGDGAIRDSNVIFGINPTLDP
ncbi:hypothetical protein A8926_7362 [Saccharopolyspora spinosa]|uniref:Uncharacterized protein n=1 Tax=Saccharopolyspora spinosa TaxID=60894 RepID=A0A2N3Y8L2_SACSN|nr:hypothetical protein A8926_7362 [Saccharopolyspora spinosa]